MNAGHTDAYGHTKVRKHIGVVQEGLYCIRSATGRRVFVPPPTWLNCTDTAPGREMGDEVGGWPAWTWYDDGLRTVYRGGHTWKQPMK